MALKVGFVTGEYPPMEGGVGAFTQEIGQALATLGHQVHIITSREARPSGDRPPSQSMGELFRRLEKLQEPVDIGFAHLHPRARRWRWGDVRLVADIVLRYELDVVNIQYQAAAYNMWSAAINLLPWRLKGLTKTVVTFHDLRTPYLFPKAGWFRHAAVTLMAQKSDGIIVTNRADEEALYPTFAAKVRHIPIGSNIEAYTPNHIELADVRDSLGLTDGHCLLGYFGFLNDSKGADDLVKALAQLSDRFHLIFIGGRTGASDSMNNRAFFRKLDDLIRGFGLEDRVHWTGFLSDTRVSTYLHAADLMVMPYKDGASLRRGTLMAAFAHGRPLITTRPNHTIKELAHGENVWFVPRNDPTQLYEAIRHLEKNPALCRELGQAARKIADLFAWDKIASDTADFFSELVQGDSRTKR